MVKRSREDSDPASDAETPISGELSPVAASSPVKPLHSTKYVELDTVEANAEAIEVMRCSLPPHRQPISFTSFEAYEIHYAKVHVNRCSECRKNFPTEHFLSLHIEENHDPLNEVRRARGEKTDYDFYVVKDGIDKRTSMLRSHRRRSSAAAQIAQIDLRARRRSSLCANSSGSGTTDADKSAASEGGASMDFGNNESVGEEAVAGENPQASSKPSHPLPTGSVDPFDRRDVDMSELTNSMSALGFVPSSIRFGRGRGKAGFSKR